MDTERARSLAEALGWVMNRLEIQGIDYWVNPAGFPTADYCMTPDILETYLSSAEGQQRIRDRVRELWCVDDHNGCDGHNRVRFLDVQIMPGKVIVMQKEWLAGRDDRIMATHEADTESKAWAEALLWLSRKKEN